jgi:hypothetical protein
MGVLEVSATVTAISERTWLNKPEVGFITGKDTLSPVPAFPLDVLGTFWRGFICDHAGKELPRDFFAVALLGSVSGLIGNSREAAMPAPSTHKEPATLWTINVGLPSTGKTPALQPFLDIVDRLEQQTDATIKIEDATVAGTIDALTENPRGIMVMNDELSGWWSTFQHDRQGETFWLKAWVGRNSYTVRRKRSSFTIPRHNMPVVGGTQPATLSTMVEATGKVEKGFVSRCMFSYPDFPVVGQVPTGNLPDNNEAFDILSSIHGLQATEWQAEALAVTGSAAGYHDQWWTDLKNKLWLDPATPEGQWVSKQRGTAIRLALVFEILWHASGEGVDAKKMKRARDLAAKADPQRGATGPEATAFRKGFEDFCDKHGIDPADVLNGRSGAHGMGGPSSISLKAMKAATDLIENYFYAHFLRCESFAYQPVNEIAAIALCRILVTKGVEEFNARAMRKWEWPHGKVHSVLHGNDKKTVEAVEEVLSFLEERHVIRKAPPKNATGRPSSDYEVNPLLKVLAKRALTRR